MRIRDYILVVAHALALVLALVLTSACSSAMAQSAGFATPAAASAPTVVPALVPYSGMAVSADGKPLNNDIGITFLIYKDEQGGEPLWTETQTVAFDSTGHYKVQLGASQASGMPLEIFASGDARWLEIQIAGEQPQPRVLVASVPYAFKAADAATLGGLPASAFVLAGSPIAAGSPAAAGAATPDLSGSTAVTTTGGSSGYLPLFTGASTIADSEIYDTGTSVGIGDVPNPAARLDINGEVIMRGNMQVARTGNATATQGYPSYGFEFFANAYNSSTKTTSNPYFQLQSEPTGNNTASPSATFNLLYVNEETGFYINPNGTIHFAPAQSFPGGTILGSESVQGGLSATSNSDYGLYGVATAGAGATAGVLAIGSSNGGFGVEAQSPNVGVYGSSSGASARGAGFNKAGVWGDTGGASGDGYIGILGTADGNSAGGFYNNGPYPAVVIKNAGTGDGIQASTASATGYGITGTSPNVGVYGAASGASDVGSNYHVNHGVWGDTGGASGQFVAVQGTADDNFAAAFYNNSVEFTTMYIANKTASNSGAPIFVASGPAYGGECDVNVNGNLNCTGKISGSAKDFKIDHPLDPANKYLVHASVESSEMMNIYTGNIVTDELGIATVKLPDWFQSENADFRYQLTVIGQFAQAIVSEEISNNQFMISTNAQHVKVSWQVTAVRQDAWAKANPLVVEEAKPAEEQGTYMHPELFGQPMEKQTGLVRRSRQMQQTKAMPAGTESTTARAF